MSRLRHFLGSVCLVGFAFSGLAYASALVSAEYLNARGWQHVVGEDRLNEGLSELRLAAQLYPFDLRYRKGPALATAIHANFVGNPPDLSLRAINELYRALRVDYSSADLLAYAIAFAVILDRPAEGRELLRRFRRVAGSSNLGSAIVPTPFDSILDGKEQPR